METTSDYLQKLTLAYWHVSSIYNGRSDSVITVGKAIDTTCQLKCGLGPYRALLASTHNLSNAIIAGRTKKVKKPQQSNILSLVRSSL